MVVNLKKTINEIVPEQIIRKRSTHKWYINELPIMQNERDIFYKRAQLTNSTVDWNNFKNMRNKYSKYIKRTHNEYIKNKIKSEEGDPKKIGKA